MRMHLRTLAAGGLFAGVLVLQPDAAAAAEPGRVSISPVCQVPPELVADASRLRHAAKRMSAERHLKIVALGSSSTLGMGASSPGAAYPARLETLLKARFPDYTVEEIGRAHV